MNAGDEIKLKFDASSLPKIKKGWTRDFLFYNDGWLKDGDLNTAQGQTVEPLPFHGMESYPYDDRGDFPNDQFHRNAVSWQRKTGWLRPAAQIFYLREETPSMPLSAVLLH